MQKEQEILSIHCAISLSDKTFCQQQHLNADDLLPVFESLKHKCDGIIKTTGDYVFRLQIVKTK